LNLNGFIASLLQFNPTPADVSYLLPRPLNNLRYSSQSDCQFWHLVSSLPDGLDPKAWKS
jgi:hypothetical protein